MSRAKVVMSDFGDEKSSKGYLLKHGYLSELFEKSCGRKVKDISFIPGKFKEYDGIVEFEDGGRQTFEMKEDKSCRRTGNICIEYFGRSGKSGISATTANYWLELIHSNKNKSDLILTLTRTAKLKRFIDEAIKRIKTLNWFRAITGGDNNSAYSYLIKEEKFIGNVVDYTVVISREDYMEETGVGEFGAVVSRNW